MRKLLVATLSAGAFAAAGSAAAATVTSTLTVNADVVASCVLSGGALNFGNYTQGSGDVSATANLDVRCTRDAPYTIAIDGGASGDPAVRNMVSSASDTLLYNVYSDAAHTTVWGDGTTGMMVSGMGAGFASPAQPYRVWGLLPDNLANKGAAVGAYADTLTVTLTY